MLRGLAQVYPGFCEGFYLRPLIRWDAMSRDSAMTDEYFGRVNGEEQHVRPETQPMTHEIDQDFDDGHGAFVVHVCNVPPTSSLSDVGILFAKAGLHHPFSFRVSESVVAVQLDTEAAVEAALALSGSILTPPKVGQINIPGQVIEVIQVAPARTGGSVLTT